jgi:hypothetical protein
MEMTSVRGKNLGGRTQSQIDHDKHLSSKYGAPLEITINKAPPSKYSTTSLSYPLNVEGNPQQGHYITFYAKVTDPAKLKAFKAAQGRVAETNKKLAAAVGGPAGGAGIKAKHVETHALSGFTLAEDRATVSAGNPERDGVKSNSVTLQSKSTMRTKTAISLYMPPSVQVSYESKYGDQEIGILAETGYEAIKAFQSGASAKAAMGMITGLEMGVKQAILKTLDVAAPGASTLFAIDRGKVITPKMELMFEGIGRRNFSFSFMFIPKSAQEAQDVKKIVKAFKYHMAADYAEGSTREMTFPDMFDIEYMHLSTRNPNLNKIATCALTKMDVEYGGDRYVSYEDGVPQTTKISLSFTEFDIITKKHIAADY